MRVYAFKVSKTDASETLESTLEKIQNEQNLENRIREVNKTEIRSEQIRLHDHLWLIDFVKIRTNNGPGRVGRSSPVEGFDFGDDEAFGEETAALYDPSTEHLLVQYNHHGVRANAIADYLSAFVPNNANLYSLSPKFDTDVERRLLSTGIHRKILFSIDLSRMSEQDRLRGAPLSEAIEYGRRTGSDKIKIEISVSGNKERSLADAALETVTSLREIFQNNGDAVNRLEISGKVDADSATEVLDLIAHRLSLNFEDLELGDDLRYSRDERWNTLIRAHNGWRHILGQ